MSSGLGTWVVEVNMLRMILNQCSGGLGPELVLVEEGLLPLEEMERVHG